MVEEWLQRIDEAFRRGGITAALVVANSYAAALNNPRLKGWGYQLRAELKAKQGGDAQEILDDIAEAATLLRPYPDDYATVLLTRAYYHAARLEVEHVAEVRREFDQLLADEPDARWAEARMELLCAKAQHSLGDYAAALRCLTAALKSVDRDGPRVAEMVHTQMALTLVRLGDLNGARLELERGAGAPDTEGTANIWQAVAAELEIACGNLERARDLLSRGPGKGESAIYLAVAGVSLAAAEDEQRSLTKAVAGAKALARRLHQEWALPVVQRLGGVRAKGA